LQKKIIINALGSEKRIAILENDKVVEILVNQPSNEPKAGDIYIGKVEKVIPGMQAAFVELGHDKNGYLNIHDTLASIHNEMNENKSNLSISQAVTQGQRTFVQIEKEATGAKGPKLTQKIELAGKYIVYLPQGEYVAVSKRMKSNSIREQWRAFGEQLCNAEEGLIMRTACEGASESEIAKEFAYLQDNWNYIVRGAKEKKAPIRIHEEMSLFKQVLRSIPQDEITEILVDEENEKEKIKRFLHNNEIRKKIKMYHFKESIFSHYNIEQEIQKALKKVVWLKSGGFITFELTEACTVIDVNTGKYTGKQNFQETVIKTNIEAAEEIARQIRLRNSSGIILIDFINMKTMEGQQQVRDALVNELKKDRTKTQVFHFTSLGILELTRKKVRQSLLDTLTTTCPTCTGIGKTKSIPTRYYELERELIDYRYMEEETLWLTVSRQLLQEINSKFSELLEALQQELPYKLVITQSDELDGKTYEIKQVGTTKEIQTRIDKKHTL
jgi:ribonuclease G